MPKRRHSARAAAKTLVERMGFRDRDLTTPAHDALLIWLDDNLEQVVDQLVPLGHAYVRAGGQGVIGPVPPPTRSIGPPKWELPILDRGRIVGFVDLAVRISQSAVHALDGTWKRTGVATSLHFEVKSRVESLGETIRQIRTYEQYSHARYVIVSPDDHFRSRLEAQGIAFVAAPAFASPADAGATQRQLAF